jgi:hypothetical protein
LRYATGLLAKIDKLRSHSAIAFGITKQGKVAKWPVALRYVTSDTLSQEIPGVLVGLGVPRPTLQPERSSNHAAKIFASRGRLGKLKTRKFTACRQLFEIPGFCANQPVDRLSKTDVRREMPSADAVRLPVLRFLAEFA